METIIALGVLTAGIITTLTLVISSVNFSRNSEQMIVVVNLAREGIEMVRAIRDTDGFDAIAAGDQVININLDNGDLGLITADNNTLADCSNCALELYNGRYLHNTSGGEITIFKRMIIITDLSSYEKKVLSKVYWMERGREHSYILESYLTNW